MSADKRKGRHQSEHAGTMNVDYVSVWLDNDVIWPENERYYIIAVTAFVVWWGSFQQQSYCHC